MIDKKALQKGASLFFDILIIAALRTKNSSFKASHVAYARNPAVLYLWPFEAVKKCHDGSYF